MTRARQRRLGLSNLDGPRQEKAKAVVEIIATESFFFDIAMPRLRGLAAFGATVGAERGCKCDIVTIRKGVKTIEVAYEPYGPPFCDIKYADGTKRRIDFKFASPAAERMGRSDKTTAVITALELEVIAYLDTLRPMLEAELR